MPETEELARELEVMKDDAVDLFDRYGDAEGEERAVLWTRLDHRAVALEDGLATLVTNIRVLRAQGESADEPARIARDIVTIAIEVIRTDIANREQRMDELRARQSSASEGELVSLVEQVARESLSQDLNLRGYLLYCGYLGALTFDASAELDVLDRILSERAESLGARIEVASSRRGSISSDAPELRALNVRIDAAVASLKVTVELMQARGLSVLEYRQLLVRTTGLLTEDVFDAEVAAGLLRQSWQQLTAWTKDNGVALVLKVILFALILAASKLFANVAARIVSRGIASREGVPALLREMAGSLVSKSVLVIGLLIAFSQLGVELGPLLAGLGIVGFVVGFALQDSLSNFAAGLMVLIYQPFDVGDLVEAAGVAGTVQQMSLVNTTIRTPNNELLIVPNGKIWGSVIRNRTSLNRRRVDLVFHTVHTADVERIRSLLLDVVRAHPSVLRDPEPVVRLDEVGEWALRFVVRPWTLTEHYLNVRWDITQSLNAVYEAEGIQRPYPHREVMIHQLASTRTDA